VDPTPKTLRAMLAESKDIAERMTDLAYGAVSSHDRAAAVEVDALWASLTDLAHRMRVVSVLAGRRTEEAEELAAVLRVVGAIEDIGRDAVDIANVASSGLPRAVIAGLADGQARTREMAGTPPSSSEAARDRPAGNVSRAVAIVVDMKAHSEVGVGLAYAALLADDTDLAREVRRLAELLDDMKVRLHRWVLRAAGDDPDDDGLFALLQLAQATEDLGDRAAEMVRPLVDGDDVHPVLALALGEADEVVVRAVVTAGSAADHSSIDGLEAGTGFEVLAIRRDQRYRYRPDGELEVEVDDEVIASGPSEGRTVLLSRFG